MNKITYHREGDYLIPNLTLPVQEIRLGRYALMHREHLKANRRVTYTNLLTKGKLDSYLLEVEQQALERLTIITKQMAQSEGVTEELKARDPMKWTQMMNSFRAPAEEQIMRELIYN